MLANLLVLAVVCAADPALETPRQPSILAPSLPQLTPEEEDKLDAIIDRFILADTGRLRGLEARQAVKDFAALDTKAIPALIRGLNKAAQLDHSCPISMISTKLARMLLSSNDPQLLAYARDEIGAGVGRTRHAGLLQDLRFRVLMRKNALARTPPPTRDLRSLSTADLVKAAGSERGPKQTALLLELETRKGKEVLAGLSQAASSSDRETSKLGRDLLDKHLLRQEVEVLRSTASDEHPAVRAAVARVAGKFPALTDTLIELLADSEPEVRAQARQTLVRLSRNTQDFGPRPEDSVEGQKEAQRKWRAWLEKETPR